MSDLSWWVAEWREELEASKLAPSSRVVYLRHVRRFVDWLAEQHPDVSRMDQITRRHIRDWSRQLAEEGLSNSTRRNALILVRKFLQYWLDEEAPGQANPADRVELPDARWVPVQTPRPEDVRRLLKQTDGRGFLDRRDTALIRLMLSTGARRSEVVGIDMGELSLDAREVLLARTKGGRPRLVTFGSRTAQALRRWIRARRMVLPDSDHGPLFITLQGERLAPGSVNALFARRSREAGLARPITPHAIRHLWASELKRRGVADDHLERLAGWRPGSPMSRRYGESVSAEHAREVVRRLAFDEEY